MNVPLGTSDQFVVSPKLRCNVTVDAVRPAMVIVIVLSVPTPCTRISVVQSPAAGGAFGVFPLTLCDSEVIWYNLPTSVDSNSAPDAVTVMFPVNADGVRVIGVVLM